MYFKSNPEGFLCKKKMKEKTNHLCVGCLGALYLSTKFVFFCDGFIYPIAYSYSYLHLSASKLPPIDTLFGYY